MSVKNTTPQLIFALWICVFHFSAAAQNFSVSGYGKFFSYVFTAQNESHRAGDVLRLGTRFQLNADASYSRVKVHAGTDIDVWMDGRGEKHVRLYPFEVYVDFYSSIFDVKAGRQFIIHGSTSWLPPADFITPWNYAGFGPEIEDYRIPVWAVKGNFYIGETEIEVALIFPESGNTYGEAISYTSLFSSVKDTEGYLKVSFAGGPVDLAIRCAYIHDREGKWSVLSLDGGGVLPEVSYLRRDFNLSIEGTYVHGWWSLRFESALHALEETGYFLEKNAPFREDTSVEWGFLTGDKGKIAIAYRHYRKWNEPGYLNFAEHRANLTVDVYPSDLIRFKLNLDAGLSIFDLMGIAFVEFKPADAFSLLIGGVLFEGKNSSLFGSLDDFDVVFFEVKGYF